MELESWILLPSQRSSPSNPMKFRYLNTETIVESDNELDSALFTKVEEKPKKKASAKKKTTVKKTEENEE